MTIETAITVRFATVCSRCKQPIAVGENAYWRPARKKQRRANVTCMNCHSTPSHLSRTKLPFRATIQGTTDSYEIEVCEDGIHLLTPPTPTRR